MILKFPGAAGGDVSVTVTKGFKARLVFGVIIQVGWPLGQPLIFQSSIVEVVEENIKVTGWLTLKLATQAPLDVFGLPPDRVQLIPAGTLVKVPAPELAEDGNKERVTVAWPDIGVELIGAD